MNPGEEVIMKKSSNDIAPFKIVRELSSGEMTDFQWNALCRDNEFMGMELGK